MAEKSFQLRGTRKFEVVTDRRVGIEIQVYFHSQKKLFMAEFADELFQDTDFKALEKQLHAKIVEVSQSIDWIPVIEIYYTPPPKHAPPKEDFSGGIKIERYYIGQRANGIWSKVSWNCPAGQRGMSNERIRRDGSTELPYFDEGRGGSYNRNLAIVRYTEASWDNLQSMIAQLHLVNGLVDRVVRSGVTLNNFNFSDQSLLPAGEYSDDGE